jgi:Uma2 family endonuclease
MAEPVTKLPTHMTVAEFLAWDRASSQNRVQLIDGEVRAQMSPATAAHGAIQAEAARLIGNHLAAGGGGAASSPKPPFNRGHAPTSISACRIWP